MFTFSILKSMSIVSWCIISFESFYELENFKYKVNFSRSCFLNINNKPCLLVDSENDLQKPLKKNLIWSQTRYLICNFLATYL